MLRPPIAQERLKLLPSGLVRIELRRPFGDGTVAVDMDPLSLLCRLAAAVPPPRFNTVRHGGVLAPAAKWRALVVPPPPPPAEDESTTEQDVAPLAEAPSPPDKPSTHRSGWRLRAELMRPCFQLEVDQCTACGGRMKLRASVRVQALIFKADEAGLHIAKILKEEKKAGLEIYEWSGAPFDEGTLHAKFMVTDGSEAIVGSYNLDPRSERLNSETALALRSEVVAGKLQHRFEKDLLPKAARITMEQAKTFRKPKGLYAKFELLFALPLKKWL